jgi:hypothetical protein
MFVPDVEVDRQIHFKLRITDPAGIKQALK